MKNYIFDIDILKKIAGLHRNLMTLIKESLNTFGTNKDIYMYIDNYICQNNLSKAFPIGISINHIIAHDSYHDTNIKKLIIGDFIKIDVGLIELGNIIDCARTFVYKSVIPQCILDCEEISNKVELYIREQIKLEGKVQIQKISALTYANIVCKGYSALDYLGGHTIEFNKVHGKHYILSKPLKLLPKEAYAFIDSSAEISDEEMFAIEIYIGEQKASGEMVKSSTIPITHYQVNDTEQLSNIKLNQDETTTLNKLIEISNNLVYEYTNHKQFNPKIIKKLIESNAIIKHEALEFVCVNKKDKIKYIQYEDCFLVRNGELINLSK